MWLVYALISALSLGFYDIYRKKATEHNNVFAVLFLNALLCTLFLSPILAKGIADGSFGFTTDPTIHAHLFILIKSVIVTTSWLLGYSAIKYLPLTIAGSINALRPVLVLLGAIMIYGESPSVMQWCGIALGVGSLVYVGFIGTREGLSKRNNKWILLCFVSVLLWAASGLYDKYLLSHRGYEPMQVEAWYNFYELVLMTLVLAASRFSHLHRDHFKWHWSILLVSAFIAIADITYFYALKEPDSMVSIASMIRRSSAIVTFLYGVFFLHEKNVRLKLVDMAILIAGTVLIVLGSL